MPDRSLRVAVAGGSIGGLCAGVALRGVGCEVDVFERSPAALASRGAGIVVQDDLLRLLRRAGAPALPTTSCLRRRYLEPDGDDEGHVTGAPQRFTSWEAIHRTVRAAFPSERHHLGSALAGFDQTASGGVTARFDGRRDVQADLLVCADGSRSDSRRRLLPDTLPLYAGYVAWRGTLDEADAPPDLVRYFDRSFTFCTARAGNHILCYLIPGAEAVTEPGHRRLNWVWYVDVPRGPALERLLTDRDGRLRASSVPAGMIRDSQLGEVRDAAARELHPRLAALVQATPDPFVQMILDVVPDCLVFGRAVLLGDAAFVVRPHTAAATAKAAADATELADALAARPGDVDGALGIWEKRRLDQGRALADHGMALGGRWTAAR